MHTTARAIGWLLIAVNLIAAGALFLGRDGGDAATRGIGRGLAAFVATLALLAALLLLWGGSGGDNLLVLVLADAIAAGPPALLMATTMSRQGLALLYPSLRDRGEPRGPVVRYAYPDEVTREAAIAIVMQDYSRLDALLRTGHPDLAARDERGVSLLGIAIRTAIMDGGTMDDLAGLRLLLAAGAKPQHDDLGPGERTFALMAGIPGPRATAALEMLLHAGLEPDLTDPEGRPILFLAGLTPDAARLLLARGIDHTTRDPRPDRHDWSPVTCQADLRNWGTALVLLEGGVPRDHAMPSGSTLARILGNSEASASDPAYRAFVAAVAARDAPTTR